MSKTGKPPRPDEFELTVFGPGYGEGIVAHIGEGKWIVVDSCVDNKGNIQAISYLQEIGIDIKNEVELIVATHWHDDHIRGISEIVERCPKATFSCAAVLWEEEFLARTAALEEKNLPSRSKRRGAKEAYKTFDILEKASRTPTNAMSGLQILAKEKCEVWALSPSHKDYNRFLRRLKKMMAPKGKSARIIQTSKPNDIAIALRIEVENITVLLGADLEKRGWKAVLDAKAPIIKKSSAFKVAHHGSKLADDPKVWGELLIPNPLAITTPWEKGGKRLPKQSDMKRILEYTERAFITSRETVGKAQERNKSNQKDIDEESRNLGIQTTPGAPPPRSAIQARHAIGNNKAQWEVKKIGSACHFNEI